MNLVSLAMNFITPAIVSRIASALGIDSKIAQMAISAALPSILAGIVGKSAKPEGLSQLTNMLGQQNPNLLSSLSGMIGGSEQSKLVNAGSNLLGSLFGNSTVGALAGAVGKFAGAGEGPTKTLLGMIAPVAMGTLAQQQKAAGLDAAGLARMLEGQKDNITKALPAGFGDLLKGSGLLDGLAKTSTSPAVKEPSKSTANGTLSKSSPAESHVRQTAAATPAGLPSWLTWGALLAALLLGWYMFGPGAGRRVAAPPTRIVHNNVDLVPQVKGIYDGLREALGTVKDQNSAQAVLPRLQDRAKDLENLVTLAGQMPPAARGDLASLIQSYLPALRGLITQALSAAGVSGVAKPVLDQILARMETLAKT